MSWKRIRGHDTAIAAFQRAWQAGRLAHAYLFVGPEGVGKRLFAVELARAVLCEGRPADRLEACDTCASCRLMDGQAHPDYLTVARPEDRTTIPIDSMREFCRKLALKPARGSRKVAVVLDADDLNDPAVPATANAFLKSLEEPAPGCVVILVGTSPDLQLHTILSRCQLVRFGSLSDTDIRGCLTSAGVTDPAMLERIVRVADGSPGQALAAADPAYWQLRQDFAAGLLRPPFDSVRLARAWSEYVEGPGKENARPRAAASLRLLVQFFEDALAVSQGQKSHYCGADDQGLLDRLAAFGPDTLLDLLDRCLDADRHIDRRVQLVLVLESLLDDIAQRLQLAAGSLAR